MRIGRLAISQGSDDEVRYATLAEPGAPAILWSAAPWEGGRPTDERVAWAEPMLRVPVRPTKILCVGRNYAAHAKELGNEVPKEPLLFLKPPSSLLDPGGSIVIPRQSKRVEHEAELALVLGRRCKNIAEADALSAVYGYTCAGDVTARDLQKTDGQWTRAKGFDGFCPVGPWIETDLDVGAGVRIGCTVNGAARQDGTTANMIFGVAVLLAYASSVMTLEPGDLILTGTPEGVGPLVSGDRLEISIEGIGRLACDVRV
jgi:2-keto-4-pentenoate hydratase/2-oxohepta-3-ene-1,7-dioic acid hydratase in catechol pathway